MSVDTTNVPYNPYYDLETGVQQQQQRFQKDSGAAQAVWDHILQ